ncbi:MAG: hypothetical protein L0216_13925 [Planctomycetales bacterium]|nr:hypothetical protein [Planctomycetales bacterium]
MTSEDLEFLVALNAYEGSFLYEVLSDISAREPEKPTQAVIDEILAVIQELCSLGLVGIGRREFISGSDEEFVSGSDEEWKQERPPSELQHRAEWEWPTESESRARWYIYSGVREIEGRGLSAVPGARVEELMFGQSGPNNSLKADAPHES